MRQEFALKGGVILPPGVPQPVCDSSIFYFNFQVFEQVS